MKGRYYSPLWHRFINSDQGVDPASINQYAYVGGSPFMAKDPSGMQIWCYVTETWRRENNFDVWKSVAIDIHYCWNEDDGGDGEAPGEGEQDRDPLCEALAKLRITNANFKQMQKDMRDTIVNQLQLVRFGTIFQESGHSYLTYTDPNTSKSVGQLIPGIPGSPVYYGTGRWEDSTLYGAISHGYLPNYDTGYAFHTHPNFLDSFTGFNSPDGHNTFSNPGRLSNGDFASAWEHNKALHFMGWDGGFVRFNGLGMRWDLAGPGWYGENVDCSRWLK
jgi:hypothetical protein